MPEPSPPAGGPNDITRLLYKAIKMLPEDEQHAVFAYFFERAIGLPQPPFFERFAQEVVQFPAGKLAPEHARAAAHASVTAMLNLVRPAGPNQQVIPVRLSEDSHRRLKEWCAEHNFPMAVVVRGLIDRFLDSWQLRAA